MFGPNIYLEFAKLLAAERPFWKHALDRFFDNSLGMGTVHDLARGSALDAAGITGVPVVCFVGELAAGKLYLFGVDDDDDFLVVLLGVNGVFFCPPPILALSERPFKKEKYY